MYQKVKRSDMQPEFIDNLMQVVFGGSQGADYYRFDYAYLFQNENKEPTSFIFCQEMTGKSVWLAFGGTIPNQRGAASVKNFKEMFDDLAGKYELIGASVHNENLPMIKIFLHFGFVVSGVRYSEDKRLFCEFNRKVSK